MSSAEGEVNNGLVTIYGRYGGVLHNVEAADQRDAIIKLVASGADLSGADLYGADLYGANLYGAHLSGANLSGANLSGANLYGAHLSRADLSGANLSRADLSRANLSGATGIRPYRVTPLLMLLDQPGKIRAYKMTSASGRSPIHPHGQITYSVGSTHEVANALPDVNEQCGAGINVATLDWIMREWQPGYRIFVVEFEATDIAAIPTATDGKFRLHRCTVVAEKDLAEIGLIEKVAFDE